MDAQVLRYQIRGSRRLSNWVFAIVVAIGGIGFLLAGLSSYFHVDLLPTSDLSTLQFIPQGLALTFYGVAGTLLDIYLWWLLWLDVGGGVNEFDKENGVVRIVRKGYPGKNRHVELVYPLTEVQAVRAEVKAGLNPKRALYLRIKGRRDIPISEVGQPMPLAQLEAQAAELVKFLGVPLEGL